MQQRTKTFTGHAGRRGQRGGSLPRGAARQAKPTTTPAEEEDTFLSAVVASAVRSYLASPASVQATRPTAKPIPSVKSATKPRHHGENHGFYDRRVDEMFSGNEEEHLLVGRLRAIAANTSHMDTTRDQAGQYVNDLVNYRVRHNTEPNPHLTVLSQWANEIGPKRAGAWSPPVESHGISDKTLQIFLTPDEWDQTRKLRTIRDNESVGDASRQRAGELVNSLIDYRKYNQDNNPILPSIQRFTATFPSIIGARPALDRPKYVSYEGQQVESLYSTTTEDDAEKWVRKHQSPEAAKYYHLNVFDSYNGDYEAWQDDWARHGGIMPISVRGATDAQNRWHVIRPPLIHPDQPSTHTEAPVQTNTPILARTIRYQNQDVPVSYTGSSFREVFDWASAHQPSAATEITAHTGTTRSREWAAAGGLVAVQSDVGVKWHAIPARYVYSAEVMAEPKGPHEHKMPKSVKKPITDDWVSEKANDFRDVESLEEWSKKKWGSPKLVYNLRDAFEIETKDGFQSEITRVSSAGAYGLQVDGMIYNSNHDPVGSFTRLFDPDSHAVKHQYMSLNRNTGTGFGSTFYQNSEHEYLQMGVKEVHIHANIDIGGYAWARMGYDFTDDYERRTMQRRLRTAVEHHYPGLIVDDTDITHAWQIAAWTGPDGKQVGKEVMLGTDWSAVKDLSDDSEGRKVGEAYYEAKKKARS